MDIIDYFKRSSPRPPRMMTGVRYKKPNLRIYDTAYGQIVVRTTATSHKEGYAIIAWGDYGLRIDACTLHTVDTEIEKLKFVLKEMLMGETKTLHALKGEALANDADPVVVDCLFEYLAHPVTHYEGEEKLHYQLEMAHAYQVLKCLASDSALEDLDGNPISLDFKPGTKPKLFSAFDEDGALIVDTEAFELEDGETLGTEVELGTDEEPELPDEVAQEIYEVA